MKIWVLRMFYGKNMTEAASEGPTVRKVIWYDFASAYLW